MLYILIRDYGYGERTIHGVTSRIGIAEIWIDANSDNTYIETMPEVLSGSDLPTRDEAKMAQL